ncbi:hypothetical protein ANCDUO_26750 [Ancylostoma duodenale]|uniref:Uncharacterized protein n=1 Tax=Ancylostoma duodenale TaxID=51022 RepID=A0A0C2F8L2_9BILA|nr:hypothetical protein ANCDUO_26750 [Ancylostoma duodenale]
MLMPKPQNQHWGETVFLTYSRPCGVEWSPKPVINWGLFTSLAGFWDDAVADNIDEEHDQLVQHLRDGAKKAEGSRNTKRRLSYETFELIRQRGAARATGN